MCVCVCVYIYMNILIYKSIILCTVESPLLFVCLSCNCEFVSELRISLL